MAVRPMALSARDARAGRVSPRRVRRVTAEAAYKAGSAYKDAKRGGGSGC